MTAHGAELTRRLDWRFLLPRATFRRAVLVGSDEALRDRAAQLGLAAVVDVAWSGSPADLVVLPADAPLGDLENLTPDGVVCLEVDRRRTPLLTPTRLRKRTVEAGLEPCGTWAVRPGLTRAESYVPIDHASPLPWYLRTQYRATTFHQRLAGALIKIFVGRDGRRLAPIVPFYVMVAAKPDAVPDAAETGSSIVLTDSGNRATELWFPEDSATPSVVTKIPKSQAFVERTRREQSAIVDLHRRLGEDLAAALPAPLGFTPWGAVVASRETVMPGVIVATRCRSGRRHMERARRDLLDASDWLTRFQLATADHTIDLAADAIDLCDAYLDRFGGTGSQLVEHARTAVPGLPPVPSVMRHPDFNVWNLLRDGDRLNVIDWEGAAPGLPLCDLFQLTVHWQECVTRRRPRLPDPEVLRAVFGRSRTSWADAAVSELLSRYMRELRIADDWFDVLAVTTWVERALRRERQLVDAGCSRCEREGANDGVAYIAALTGVWQGDAQRKAEGLRVA